MLRSSIIKTKNLFKSKTIKKDTFLFFHIQKTAASAISSNYIPKAFPGQFITKFSTIEEGIISRNSIMNMSDKIFQN